MLPQKFNKNKYNLERKKIKAFFNSPTIFLPKFKILCPTLKTSLSPLIFKANTKSFTSSSKCHCFYPLPSILISSVTFSSLATFAIATWRSSLSPLASSNYPFIINVKIP